MIYTAMNKTDAYCEFIGENGGKLIAPTLDVILVDDDSGFITIKLKSSRKILGLLRQ